MVASYLACTGQIGMHDELAQQAGRVERLRVSRLRRYPDLEPEPAGDPLDQPIAECGRQARHWIWLLAWRSEKVIVGTGHAELGFGRVVPRRQIRIAQGPVLADTVAA